MPTSFVLRILEWLWARTIPSYNVFARAKQIHYSSPHSALGYYRDLTDQQIEAACNGPVLARAKNLYHESIALESNPPRFFNEATAHYQLGLLFQTQGHLAEAEQEFEYATNLANNLPNPGALGLISDCLFRRGEIALAEGNFKVAYKYLKESHEIDGRLRNVIGMDMSRTLLEDIPKS